MITTSQADRIYKNLFRKNFTNYEANFPPTKPVKLGDFGTFDNGYLTIIGNIESVYNLQFDTVFDNDPTNEKFKTEGSVTITSYAKGDIKPSGVQVASASIDFSFNKKDSIFFSSAATKFNYIKDLVVLAQKILELYQEGKWKKNYFLVTSLIEGENVVIIIGESKNSSLTISAKSDEVKQLDLADAEIKFSISSSSNTAYEIATDNKVQIGFGLSRIYNPLFGEEKFESSKQLFTRLDNDNKIDDDGLVFGRINPSLYDV